MPQHDQARTSILCSTALAGDVSMTAAWALSACVLREHQSVDTVFWAREHTFLYWFVFLTWAAREVDEIGEQSSTRRNNV